MKSHSDDNWIEDPDLFMAMDDLELVARGVVEGAIHGLHQSPYIGFSVEFDTHRDYQPGDELRHVNWNLWAKTDRLYVKQFKSDTNLNLYLLIDSSRSMLCDHGPAPKWRYAARAAASLAYLALGTRDAAGIYLLQDRLAGHVPPRVRPDQFAEILAVLQNAEPQGSTNLARSLEEILHLCRRRGIVVLLSDLFDDDDAVFRCLDSLRFYGHQVLVMHLLDPWEERLPERGQYEFRDLETGEKLSTHAPAVRQAYAREVRQWRQTWKRRCEGSGIDWLPCTTDLPLQRVLVDYILKRSGMD